MWQVIAGFLGGMGLFFAGLKLTGDGVKKIAGRRFRDLFLKWTRRPLQGVAVGAAAGFLFQSTSGLSLLLASLIGAGITTVRNALPVLLGSNAGVSFLVLVAVVDIRIPILVLLGFSGLVIAFEKPWRLVDLAGIAFGVGLILFGLGIVRESTAPLAQAAWFKAFLASQGLALPWYGCIGAVACLLLQTSAGVAILAVTLAASGVFDSNDALAVIYGSLFGSSLLSRFYALPLTGAQKRLAMGQVYFNYIGLAVFVPIFIVENYAHVPLLQAAMARLLPSVPEQLTAIGIVFDCATALLLLVLVGHYDHLLTWLHPDAPGASRSLAHIREVSEMSPETALFLLNREQEQLVRLLPVYTDRLRQNLGKNACVNVRDLHQRLLDRCAQLDDCLLDLVTRGQAEANANAVALLQGNQAVLRSISEGTRLIVEALSGNSPSATMVRLASIFLEALETLLTEVGHVFPQTDAAAWDLFLALVADKSPVMDRVRKRYLTEESDLSPEEKGQVLRVTGLFERCVWLLSRLGEQQRHFLIKNSAMEATSCVPFTDRTL